MAAVVENGDAAEMARRTTAKSAIIAKPQLGNRFEVDTAIIKALPVPGTELVDAFSYGMSLWGRTAKMLCRLPNGEPVSYFLKCLALGETGRLMAEGEFEALKEIHGVSPVFAPKPHAWGRFEESEPEQYFFLAEFRDVGDQPPDPIRFTARLAEMHQNSVSPTGKFGFHTTTCHTTVPQITNCWEEKWYKLYQKQLGLMVKLDVEKNGLWPEFKVLCDLTLEEVIPRLLAPLQSDGRNIKPCLIHGDLWDENAATDMNTGEPFVFDAASFYGHNEYETGNWRTPRHRLSNKVYVRNYKRNFPVSEPEEDWEARNLLYSLRYELHAAVVFPGSKLRQVVYEGMTELCTKYCPEKLKSARQALKNPGPLAIQTAHATIGEHMEGQEEEEEEEEEPEPEPED